MSAISHRRVSWLEIYISVRFIPEMNQIYLTSNEECVVCEKFKAKFESMNGLDHDIVCEKQ